MVIYVTMIKILFHHKTRVYARVKIETMTVKKFYFVTLHTYTSTQTHTHMHTSAPQVTCTNT